jgi:hypothetical protein
LRITFFDRQNPSNPLNSTVVITTTELLDILNSLKGRQPFFCELVGENGFNLLLGVGGDISCAQYSPSDGSTPYLMATLGKGGDADDYAEFLINNTLTPIPFRYCIRFETAKEIAAHFLKTGERSHLVVWEQI